MRGARTGYGVLELKVRPEKVDDSLDRIMGTYGRYMGEIATVWEYFVDYEEESLGDGDTDPREFLDSAAHAKLNELLDKAGGKLREILESGAACNLRTLAPLPLHLGPPLWANPSKLVRLDLSNNDNLHDKDVSLCCGNLPCLIELLVSCTFVAGVGWLDDRAKRKRWRVLHLDETEVLLPLITDTCNWAAESLVELGLNQYYDEADAVEVEQFRKAIKRCTKLRGLFFYILAEADFMVQCWSASTSLRALSGEVVSIQPDFFYQGLVSCNNIEKLELINTKLKAPDEELKDMFQWIGSIASLRWFDIDTADEFPGRQKESDECITSLLAGLKSISPAPLNVLKLAGWNITDAMLCDLLRSCPNITFLDLQDCPVTAEKTAFMHGLFSKRIRRLPSGNVEFRCPVHGISVAKGDEINEGVVSLLDAGGRIWEWRAKPACGVKITDSSGKLVESFCKEGPKGRCAAAEVFRRGRPTPV
ncbi:hypothetical protein FOZ60_016274 [Perkinsus olseni]|uniref:Uncharacterized protein n=1 Tax=Perkinsus olseni TaxID=32597 RepID=A0A7J6P4Q4_PEROL|nr:hypothetical protein FOZ60_016274 [Perkinsus olseni]